MNVRRPAALYRPRRGFTLIELLAAMTILTIMVLLISRIFSDSSKMWRLGAKRVESNTDGRAAIDFMVKELSSTLCDGSGGPLGLLHNSSALNTLGLNSDNIKFVTSDQRAERRNGIYYRQVEEIVYELKEMQDTADNPVANRYRLVRTAASAMSAITCYEPGGFPKKAIAGSFETVLADNVRTLEFWVYATNGAHYANYDSKMYGRPACIEVYMELLGEEDAIKASLLPAAAAKDFCDRNVRRYVGRAYLNANGGKS